MNKSSLFAEFPPFFLLHSKTPPTDDRKEEWNNKIFSLDLKISVSEFLGLEHLQQYLVCDPAKIFLPCKFSYLPCFQPHP
jgi:hypothetical protein